MNISVEGNVVCDPFMGSGTTGLACHRLKRAFIGVEKNPEYFNLAYGRMKAEVNQLQLF
jgi:DNA modification methylase